MNDETKTPQPNREDLEQRITAMLLGEANDAEKATLLEAIEKDSELKAFYQSMQKTIGLVEEVSQAQATTEAQPKLSSDRKAALFEALEAAPAKVPTEDNAANSRMIPFSFWGSLAACLAIMLSVAVFWNVDLGPVHINVEEVTLGALPPENSENEVANYQLRTDKVVITKAQKQSAAPSSAPILLGFDADSLDLEDDALAESQLVQNKVKKVKLDALDISIDLPAVNTQSNGVGADITLAGNRGSQTGDSFNSSGATRPDSSLDQLSFSDESFSYQLSEKPQGASQTEKKTEADFSLFADIAIDEAIETESDLDLADNQKEIPKAKTLFQNPTVTSASIHGSSAADYNSNEKTEGAAAEESRTFTRSRSISRKDIGDAFASAKTANKATQPTTPPAPTQALFFGTHAPTESTVPEIAAKAKLQTLPEQETAQNAVSTFSLNVSDVSFQLANVSLSQNVLPTPESIRSEEFINAFNYRDKAPTEKQPIAFHYEQARSPFGHDRDLLRLSLQTASTGRSQQQPLNLVLLLDNSGSMERPDRQETTANALNTLAQNLQSNDTISVVSFARTPRLVLDGVDAQTFQQNQTQLNELVPEGGTNIEEALDFAYETAQRNYNSAAFNRVVLLTDGAANLGQVDPQVLQNQVSAQRQKGIALDTYGIGWENYNDQLLEQITRHSDGRYAFLNTPEDADKKFTQKLAGAFQSFAADVKVQVTFNSQRITRYRQIGYEKHQLAKEDFRDNTVDAAELGQAETGNALYSLQINREGEGDIGQVSIRYRDTKSNQYHERSWPIPYNPMPPALADSSPAMRLACTAATFAEWLARNPYSTHVQLAELETLAHDLPQFYNPDPLPGQLLFMIQQARTLAGQ